MLLRQLLIIFLAPLLFCFSQTEMHYVENYGLDEGLSSSTIFSIVQDSTGFIWIGTSAGLDRFDGVNFNSYTNIPHDSTSLSANLVQHVLVDVKNRLWISTREGLNLYNREKDNFKNYLHNPDDPSSIQNDDIWHAYEDSKGFIWLCTRRNGLIKFNPENENFTLFAHDESDSTSISSIRVTDVIEDNTGVIWALGVEYDTFSLNKLNNETQSFTRYYFPEISSAPNVITKDSEGSFWIGSFKTGIVKFDPISMKYDNFPFPGANHSVRSILIDSKNDVWSGTSDGGIYKFSPETKKYQQFYFKENSNRNISFPTVWDVFEDQSKMIWIGTFGGGIDVLKPDQELFNLDWIPESEKREKMREVTSFLETENGELWIGTYGNGLFIKRENKVENITRESGGKIQLLDNRINDILQDSSGNIWIATITSITIIDKNRETIRIIEEKQNDESLSSGAINDLMLDAEGCVWIATHIGINIIDPSKKEIKKIYHDPKNPNSPLSNHPYHLFEDSQNQIWIATGAGVSVLSADRTEYKHYRVTENKSKSLSSNFVVHVEEDRNNNIWLATSGGGVNKINQNGTIEAINQSHGLVDDRISSILFSEDSTLWVSTKKGLSKIDLKANSINNFYETHGLAGNEFVANSAYINSSGKIFLGGNKGFNSFLSATIKESENNANLVLTGFKLFNKPYKLGKQFENVNLIELEYNQNFFSFEFVLLDFTSHKMNKYYYKLEGINENWIDNGNKNSVDYTSVDPGKYLFKVKAKNSENVWAKKELEIELIISPPFYQTWWFVSLSVLAFAGILYSFYLYRINELKKVQNIRNKIHKNLHDEIGSTLTSINMFARSMEAKISKNKYTERIIKSSADARDKIKDIMWIVDPNNDNINFLITKMIRTASDLFEAQGIEYNIYNRFKSKNLEVKMEVRQNIWLIFREITTNIIKHSRSENVKIEIDGDSGNLTIFIEDDGIGFDEEKIVKGNGLLNIKNRISELNGTGELISKPGAGVKYRIKIQI